MKRGLAMKVLTIKLAGPLQSYGNEAAFNRRTSYHCPSKSAIVGMIAAALGYRRDDHRIGQLNKLRFAVRVDQPGQNLTDFQTIEYDQKKQKRKVTYRNYLQDAIFLVAIAGDDDQILKIQAAMHHPKFQLFMGRRANVPAGPLKTEVFDNDNPVSVLETLAWQAASWYQKRYNQETFSAELLADAGLMPNIQQKMVKDNAGSFDQNNRFHSYRAVAKTFVKLKNNNYQVHDAMSFL